MKRFFAAVLLVCALVTVSVFAEETNPVTVTLNGDIIDCASYGQEAIIVEGRTLVPLRAIFESLGATVEWDAETRTVSSVLGTTEISLKIGEKTLSKNGEKTELDVPAQIMNGRTLVPVRAISESFGIDVVWESETRTVVLMSGVYAYNAYLNGFLEEMQPKSELDKEILAYAGGIPVSAASVRSYVMSACNNGMDVNDEAVAKEIEGFYKQYAALVHFAFNERVALDKADANRIKSNIIGLQIQLGDNYEKAFAASPYTEFYYHLNLSLYPVVFSKVADVYVKGTNEEIYKKVLGYFEENDYVRAKHILIKFPGVDSGRESTEEEKKATFSKALDVLVQVNAMKSPDEFDALVEKYNEDPGMTSSPYGYYFTKGEMVKPFEDATYALEVGKTSSLVETTYGYHIIQRLPLDDESLVNTQEYASAVSGIINETIIDASKGLTVEYADNYNERVEDFVQEYMRLFEGQ